MQPLTPGKDGLNLLIKVMPKTARQSLGPIRGGRLLVYLNAPPVDGAANQALIKFLGKSLGLPLSSLSITSGLKSRNKTVLIKHMEPEQIVRKLAEA